jgi:predicted GIY-YIG superfamily endonuclease
MGAFVYMLQCADGSYYVGSATGDDLSKRVAEHQLGTYQGYTYPIRAVRFVWFGQNTLIGLRMQLRSNERSKAGVAQKKRRWPKVIGPRSNCMRNGAPESQNRHPEVAAKWPSKDTAEAPGPSPFEARCARTSG